MAERAQLVAGEIGRLASGALTQADAAGNRLEAMVPAITKTAEFIDAIAAACEEQSVDINHIN